MFQLSPILVSCFCFVLFIVRYWRERRANPQGLPLPPGPRALPIIGNVHQTPKDHDWLRYTEWANEYGPLVYFRLFGQDVVLVNSHKAAIDLFDKRSGIYSDRPRTFTMAAELIGWDQGVSLRPSDQRHRRYRKLLAGTLGPTAARKLWSLQEIGAQKFLGNLAETPDQFYNHIRTSVSETIVMIIFGQECSKEEFPYIEMAERSHAAFTVAASPYAYAVDFLPTLRHLPEWFPGAGFKRQARIWNAELQELVHFPYRAVESDLKKGKARSSFVADLISTDQKLSPEQVEDVMWAAASFYTGGVDTTVAAVMVFMLAMCLNQHVQTKAQAELDKVVGTDRLPTIADREHLPYLDACLKEVFRWYPMAPLGVAHRVKLGDSYNGYYIPEGTTVISNIWAMSRNPEVYSSPEEFRPERFLPGGDGEVLISVNGFGFGRRICPGQHMADTSLFIYMARTLATFNIAKPRDDQGKEIEPEVEFASGLISHPKPFKCAIAVRSGRAAELIGAD